MGGTDPVANETHPGNLRLYPAGSALPQASTINFSPLVTRANNAVIGLGPAGEISVRCFMPRVAGKGWLERVRPRDPLALDRRALA